MTTRRPLRPPLLQRGILSLQPALLAVILSLIALTGVQTWRLHRAQLQAAELRTAQQADRRQAAEALATAHAEARRIEANHRALEQAWIQRHQEIAREAQNQAQRTAAAAADARLAGDGLRQRAAALAASGTAACAAPADPAPAPSSPPAPSPAVVLADVLGRLEEDGRDLAEIADAPADPAPSSPPAASPAVVLADVLGRLEAAGRELAAVADARGVAGHACQQAYQTLLRPSDAPD